MKGTWNRKGFTLMEVIVSLAILALALVALLGIRDSSIKSAAEAERLTRAVIVAKKVVGMIELNGLDKEVDEGMEGGFIWVAAQTPLPGVSLKELRLTLWQDKKNVLEIVEYIPNGK